MLHFLKERLRALTYHSIILKLITALAAASLVEVLSSPYMFTEIQYFTDMRVGLYFLLTFSMFVLLALTVPAGFDGYVLLSVLTVLFVITNAQAESMYYAIVTSLVIGGFVFFLADRMRAPTLGRKTTFFLCTLFGTLLALFIAVFTILPYLLHRTPNFDFGIFSQMFHYMAKTGIPYTTCERDMLLSHFAVHFSPILYLALPFYMIFPHPTTLLAVQALAVASSVFPLYKLAKHFGLSNSKTVAVVLMFILHPTVIANNFFYFHENCFLTVLLLWMFYFAETKKPVPMYIFAVLTMAVKEDAPIYVLFFAMYLLFSNKSKRHGTILGALSCIYFGVVTHLMSVYGNGIMSYRYDQFIFEKDGSIYSVILNILKNPSYLFTQILSAEKLTFLILMLVPMALLPFAIRKPSAIILLFPMVLMNLMPSWQYQYDISFQYTYGTVAFLFYLTVMNLGALHRTHAKKLLLCGVSASLFFFSAVNYSKTDKIGQYKLEKPYAAAITEAIAVIPEDASVCASTFLVPALWNRDVVYDYKYSDKETDYVVLDLRWGSDDFYEFQANNPDYKIVLFHAKTIAIFQKE